MEDRQTSQRPTLRNRTTRNGGGFVVWNSVSAFSERKPKQYVINSLGAGISHPAILSVQISGDEISHLSQIHHEQYFSTKEIVLCMVAGIFWVDTSEWF